jgi:hypothetical protein
LRSFLFTGARDGDCSPPSAQQICAALSNIDSFVCWPLAAVFVFFVATRHLFERIEQSGVMHLFIGRKLEMEKPRGYPPRR